MNFWPGFNINDHWQREWDPKSAEGVHEARHMVGDPTVPGKTSSCNNNSKSAPKYWSPSRTAVLGLRDAFPCHCVCVCDLLRTKSLSNSSQHCCPSSCWYFCRVLQILTTYQTVLMTTFKWQETALASTFHAYFKSDCQILLWGVFDVWSSLQKSQNSKYICIENCQHYIPNKSAK